MNAQDFIWLADFQLIATGLLTVAIVIGSLVGQPAKRLALAWGTVGALALLLVATAVPGWSVWSLQGPGTPPPVEEPEVALAPIQRPAPMIQAPPQPLRMPPVAAPIASPSTEVAPLEVETIVPAEVVTIDYAQLAGRLALPVYLLGSAATGVWLLVGGMLARRLVGQADEADTAIRTLAAVQGARAPRLLVSDRLSAAVAIGLRKPTIVLPRQLAERANPTELRTVLAHELAHLRGGDLWLLAALRLLMVPLWPNPFYWGLRRRVRLDQETLADAAAADLSDRHAYAEQLVGWAREMAPQPRLAGAAGLWEGPSQLGRRIAVLLDDGFTLVRRSSPRWRALCGAACLALAGVGSLVTLGPAEVLSSDRSVAETQEAANQAVADARDKSFGLENADRIVIRQLWRQTDPYRRFPITDPSLNGWLTEAAKPIDDERLDHFRLEHTLCWSGDRFYFGNRDLSGARNYLRATYWDGRNGWLKTGNPYVARTDEINRLHTTAMTMDFPQLDVVGGRLLWPGREVVLRDDHEVDPALTKYTATGTAIVDGVACDIYDGPERREKIWVEQATGLIKAYSKHLPAELSDEAYLKAFQEATDRDFADARAGWEWLDAQPVKVREEVEAKVAAARWSGAKHYSVKVFSDYDEIAPGVRWPRVCRWVTSGGDDSGWTHGETRLQEVGLDPDMEGYARTTLPRTGGKVQDWRSKPTLEYDWYPSLTEEDIAQKRRLLREQEKLEEEVERRYAETPIETIEDALRLIVDGPNLDPTEAWARAMMYLAERPGESLRPLINALDQERRDHPIRKLAFTLRAIGDRRAVPALIRALPQTHLPPASDFGLRVAGGKLGTFLQEHDQGRATGGGPLGEEWRFSYGRAVREVAHSLRTLTGKDFGEKELFSIGRSDNAAERARQQRRFHEIAKRWAEWWDEEGAGELAETEFGRVDLPGLEIAAKREEINVVAARHVLLLEGEEIATLDEIEQRVKRLKDPRNAQINFYSTPGSRFHGDFSEIWKRYDRDYGLASASFRGVNQTQGARYDRIQNADDLRNDPARQIRGAVTTAGGDPVAGAEVLLVTPLDASDRYGSHPVWLRGGRIANPMSHVLARTNSEGAFELQLPDTGPYKLVALHPELGFGFATQQAYKQTRKVAIAPWARLEVEAAKVNDEPHSLSIRTRLQGFDPLPHVDISLQPFAIQAGHAYSKPTQTTVFQVPAGPFCTTSLSRSFPVDRSDPMLASTYVVMPELELRPLAGDNRSVTLGAFSSAQKKELASRREASRERHRGLRGRVEVTPSRRIAPAPRLAIHSARTLATDDAVAEARRLTPERVVTHSPQPGKTEHLLLDAGGPIVTERDLEAASVSQSEWSEGEFFVTLSLTAAGGERMKKATSRLMAERRDPRPRMAILVEGKVDNAPRLLATLGRSIQISGSYDRARADEIAGLLVPKPADAAEAEEFVVFAAAPTPQGIAGGDPNTLAGLCADAAGEPLAGVVATLLRKDYRTGGLEHVGTQTTDAWGRFRWEDVLEDPKKHIRDPNKWEAPEFGFWLVLKKEGLTSQVLSQMPDQLARSGGKWNVVMRPAAVLRGQITGAAGEPLAGARVRVAVAGAFDTGEGAAYTAVSGSDGRYVINDLPSLDFAANRAAEAERKAKEKEAGEDVITFFVDEGYVTVTHPGHATKKVTLDKTPGELDVTLGQPVTIEGRVVGEDGEPLTDVPVVVASAAVNGPINEFYQSRSQTGDDGLYRVDTLPAGKYRAVIEQAPTKPGVLPARIAVSSVRTAAEDATETHRAPDLRYVEGRVVEFQLVDAQTREPVPYKEAFENAFAWYRVEGAAEINNQAALGLKVGENSRFRLRLPNEAVRVGLIPRQIASITQHEVVVPPAAEADDVIAFPISPGRGEVEVEGRNAVLVPGPVPVQAAEKPNVVFIEGRVVGDDGEPLAGKRVYIRSEGDGETRSASTQSDDEGR